MMTTPETTRPEPLSTPEQAVALLLDVFHRQADDVLQGNGDFDSAKQQEMENLHDALKSNINKIQSSFFPLEAGAEPTPGLMGGNPVVCCNNYNNCLRAGKPFQQCQQEYIACMSS